MRLRDTLLGLAVLGLVAGGVLWARARTGTAASRGDQLVDVTSADGVVTIDDLTLVLAVEPRPPVAFAAHRWRVRAAARGAALPVEQGRLTFEMVMPMGDHRYSLVRAADGWWEAEVVLPSCPSGKRRWFATFEGTIAGEPRTARVRVDLAPPAIRPAP